MPVTNEALCQDELLEDVLALLHKDSERGLTELERLLGQYPSDPRLHFLYGSILAGHQRYPEGRLAMAQALEIAPDFALARFQLGFLELTSGLADAAINTWLPFLGLPEGAYFRLLSEGLTHLVRDEFAECDRLLRLGMTANEEHPLINADMQLILNEIKDKVREDTEAPDAEPVSATLQLLQQFAIKDSDKTRH